MNFPPLFFSSASSQETLIFKLILDVHPVHFVMEAYEICAVYIVLLMA